MTASLPATGTSAKGRQSTVMPRSVRSAAINRELKRAAWKPNSGTMSYSAPKVAPGGLTGQCGGPSRATRPPSWSIRTGASGLLTESRNSLTSEVTCAGVSILRLKRMKPHGRSARTNARSSALSSSPEMPVMNARLLMGRIRPLTAPGSRKPPSIPLDDALPAGGFQTVAELGGLAAGAERADHGAVIDALFAEIHTPDRSRTGPQHGRVLALHHSEGG